MVEIIDFIAVLNILRYIVLPDHTLPSLVFLIPV